MKKRGLLEKAIQTSLVAGEKRLRAAFAHNIGGGPPKALVIDAPENAITEQLTCARHLAPK